MVGFSKRAKKATQETPPEVEGFAKKEYVRDTTDNKLFKGIQIDDISKLIHKDTVAFWDYDTPIYKICSNLENKMINVTLKTDPSVSEDIKNITTFRGRSSKTVAESSWLGLLNIDRELKGQEPLSQDDFEITQKQVLKYDSEDAAFEQAKIELFKGMKKIRKQYLIENIKLVIGSGDNFRHKLPLCRPYKGTRQETLRPLLLKRVREWAVEELKAIDVKPRPDGENIEADDYCEFYGAKGIQSYRKTGKFDYIVIASDKDATNSGKLLINPDTHVGDQNPLRGKFKFPQPMLIKSTDKCVGDLELVKKSSGSEVKGYGFLFLLYQGLLGQDQADNYNALSHLGRKDIKFGDLSAYKVLKPCTTAKEALEACINTYYELLPEGVQYTTHDGIEMDVDTMTYMDTYFRVAYMTRSETDTMDFYKLCKAFKVDTSKVVGNNVPVIKPLAPEQEIRDTYEDVVQQLKAISEVLQNTKGKKSDLVDNMGKADKLLEILWCDLGNGLFVEEDK